MSVALALVIAIMGYVASLNNVGAEYLRFEDHQETQQCADSNSQPK